MMTEKEKKKFIDFLKDNLVIEITLKGEKDYGMRDGQLDLKVKVLLKVDGGLSESMSIFRNY